MVKRLLFISISILTLRLFVVSLIVFAVANETNNEQKKKRRHAKRKKKKASDKTPAHADLDKAYNWCALLEKGKMFSFSAELQQTHIESERKRMGQTPMERIAMHAFKKNNDTATQRHIWLVGCSHTKSPGQVHSFIDHAFCSNV